jgi:hypothetical protein
MICDEGSRADAAHRSVDAALGVGLGVPVRRVVAVAG